MDYDTSLPINDEVRDDLRAAKKGGETYSETITRLLVESGASIENTKNAHPDDVERVLEAANE